jgi:hypothetical protein
VLVTFVKEEYSSEAFDRRYSTGAANREALTPRRHQKGFLSIAS